MTRSCFHYKNRSRNTRRARGALRSAISSRFRRVLHNRLIPQQLTIIRIPSPLRTLFKKAFTVVRLITSFISNASPTADKSVSALPSTGVPVVAIDLPGIKTLFKTSLVRYSRLPHVRVQARCANQRDLQDPLTTYVTDRQGNIQIETEKHFTTQDATTGIIFLRYPDPINDPLTNPWGKAIYNEWYIPLPGWSKSYNGIPGEEYASYESKKPVEKQGLVITPEVIKILGGRDGKAEVQPGWGGSMLALEGGLLVSDGSCIAPKILEKYYKSEGLAVGETSTRTRDGSNEVKADL